MAYDPPQFSHIQTLNELRADAGDLLHVGAIRLTVTYYKNCLLERGIDSQQIRDIMERQRTAYPNDNAGWYEATHTELSKLLGNEAVAGISLFVEPFEMIADRIFNQIHKLSEFPKRRNPMQAREYASICTDVLQTSGRLAQQIAANTGGGVNLARMYVDQYVENLSERFGIERSPGR